MLTPPRYRAQKNVWSDRLRFTTAAQQPTDTCEAFTQVDCLVYALAANLQPGHRGVQNDYDKGEPAWHRNVTKQIPHVTRIFASANHSEKGCFAYRSGPLAGLAYWGTGGTRVSMAADVREPKYRVLKPGCTAVILPPVNKGNCEVDVNECVSSPCGHGSLCSESSVKRAIPANTYQCSCAAGFTGGWCDPWPT